MAQDKGKRIRRHTLGETFAYPHLASRLLVCDEPRWNGDPSTAKGERDPVSLGCSIVVINEGISI